MVLGFLVVMSLLALAIVGASRTSITDAGRGLLRMQAQAAVDSAVNEAIAELVAATNIMPEIALAPRRLDVGGFTVTLSVRAEHAKVDINHADANLLGALFRAGGADPDTAQALAAAVEDWRDADDLVHVKGAERRQYADAGLSYGPANAFFKSADELSLVLGVTAPLFACLQPEVTVFSQRQGIDIEHAAPMIRRAAGVEDAESEPPLRASVTSERAIAAGDVFEITARLDDAAHGVRRAERVIVRITGNPQDPYWVLSTEAAFPLEEGAARNCPRIAAGGP